MRALCAALAILAAAQDGPGEERIRRLLNDLGHDDVDVRERAERELEAAGEAAAPHLRRLIEGAAGDENERTLRAAAVLRRIERAAKVRAACREPAPLRLRLRDAELGAALAEIARQAGVGFADPVPDAPRRVTLETEGRPLLAVLDDLCRQAGLSYRWEGERAIRLLPEPSPPCPAAYPGPFRVRVTEIRLERRTDFKERTAHLRIRIESDYERSLQPLGRPSVSLREARDDRGSDLEIREGAEDLDSAAGAVRILVRQALRPPGSGAEERQDFTLSGLALGASKVSLRGTLRCAFPLETRDVRLTPEAGAQADAGDVRVRVERVTAGRLWVLSFTPARDGAGEDLAPAIPERLRADSLVAVDERGDEHRGTLVPMPDAGASIILRNGRRAAGNAGRVTFQVVFPIDGTRAIREVRFRFVTDTHVRELPFALEGIELP